MAKKKKTLHSYYAARASEYDLIYQKPERQRNLQALQEWLPTFFEDARMLEVACGTGFWTQFIAPVAAKIFAVDIAVETLQIARRRVPTNKVAFMIADAYSLPCRADEFDAAFAGFWFSHVPKSRQRAFLVSLGKTLRPGANVVLIDNRFVPGSSTPISESDGDGNTYQSRKLDDGSTHMVLKNFPTESVLPELAEGLGEQIEVRMLEYYWVLHYSVA